MIKNNLPSNLPSYYDLQYFLEVSNTKNVTRAAERLGITQPSLSASLKRLETLLGTPLLIRKKTGVQLTPAGHYVSTRGRALLQDWNGIRAKALNHTFDFAGRFSIGCHPSVARYALPSFLPKLLKNYPHIEISLEHDLSRNITEAVIQNQIDFGIVVNPIPHLDLVLLELCTDKVTVLDRSGKYSDTLIYDPNLLQSQVILQKLLTLKIKFVRTITSSNLEVIRDLAEGGAGTAILPTRVAQHSKKKLKPPASDIPYLNDHVCLAYRADSQKTAAAKIVIQTIKKAKI